MLDVDGEDVPRWLKAGFAPRACALLCLIVVACGIGFLLLQRRVIEARELGSASLYARVLEDHANRSLNVADVSLRSLSETVVQASDSASDVQLSAALSHAIRSLPFVRSLSVLGPTGVIEASSNRDNLGASINLADLGIGPSTTLAQIGPLHPGRDLVDLAPPASAALNARRWLVTYTHVVPIPRLSRAKYLVATLNPDFFSNAYELTLGESTRSAALLNFDAHLIAATPGITMATGEIAKLHTAFTSFLPQRESGSFIAPGLDGAQTISAFRATRSAPWLILVEQPYTAVNAELWGLARWVGLVVLATCATVCALCLLAWRSLRGHSRSQQRLRNQIHFTERMLAVSPAPLYVTDAQNQLVMVNHAWCAASGVSAEKVLGQTIASAWPALASAVARLPANTSQAELQLPWADKGLRHVLFSQASYLDADEQPLGTIHSLTDVSEFREAEKRIGEARDAAEQANAVKTEFIANMSHELRTPLQSIIGFSELGLARSLGDSKAQHLFERVHAAGKRMLVLVNALLDLARSDAASSRIELKKQAVAPVVNELVDELQALAQSRNLTLVADADMRCVAALDAFSFGQVLRNVIANAIRFAPPQSEITVRCNRIPVGGTLITVRDHGPGIPAAEVEAIFEPFVQSSLTKDGSGGTGLGLAICRKLMNAHKGRIWAENHPSGGAVFSIELPAA